MIRYSIICLQFATGQNRELCHGLNRQQNNVNGHGMSVKVKGHRILGGYCQHYLYVSREHSDLVQLTIVGIHVV